jgi:hypothetical protein
MKFDQGATGLGLACVNPVEGTVRAGAPGR